MSPQELTQLLDGLDRRLALGEIDLGTYSSLKSKFTSQGNGQTSTSGTAVLETTVSSMRKEAVALRCPSCMAPMKPPESSERSVVTCEYCGGSFALQTAQSEMDQLKSGIRKWISELAGSAGTGGNVDEAARRFIFNDKLLPSLKLEANRAVEVYAFSRHQALFSFPLIDSLGNTPFQQAIASAPDLTHIVSRVKMVIARVQDPEVIGFAVGEPAKANLNFLETNCQEIIYLSNARKTLSGYQPDGFAKSATNLRAAHSLYQKAANSISATDKQLAALLNGLSNRTKAVGEAIDILASVLRDNPATDVQHLSNQVAALAAACDQAANEIEQSGRDPRETVPAVEGSRADASALRIFSKVLQLYYVADPDRGESFVSYLQNCQALISSARSNDKSLVWLDEFTNHLSQILAAVSGEGKLATINRFEWAQGKADAGIQSSLFGGSETVVIDRRVLVPFWLAKLCSSEQKGFIFKKGREVESRLLLDASKTSGAFVRPEANTDASTQISTSLQNRSPLGGATVLAPVLGKAAAIKRFKEIIQSTPEFAGGYAELQEIIYLPVAVAKYTGKKGVRSVAVGFIDGCVNGSLSPIEKKIGRYNISVAA